MDLMLLRTVLANARYEAGTGSGRMLRRRWTSERKQEEQAAMDDVDKLCSKVLQQGVEVGVAQPTCGSDGDGLQHTPADNVGATKIKHEF